MGDLNEYNIFVERPARISVLAENVDDAVAKVVGHKTLGEFEEQPGVDYDPKEVISPHDITLVEEFGEGRTAYVEFHNGRRLFEVWSEKELVSLIWAKSSTEARKKLLKARPDLMLRCLVKEALFDEDGVRVKDDLG